MSRLPRIRIPLDQNGLPVHRGMGMPVLVRDRELVSATYWSELFDFSAEKYQTRVFTGIAIENLSTSSRVRLAYAPNLTDTPVEFFDIGTQQFAALDFLQFGPGIIDDSNNDRCVYIFGRLDVAQGTAASGTIDYSGSGNPTDGQYLTILGEEYEFSTDTSKAPSRDHIVTLGGSADVSWQNLVNKINSVQRKVRASINTTTDIVTIDALYGAYGNSFTIADGDTGAVFSGATLSGGSGGVNPITHIW